jgi:hypothetical protein
MQRFVNQEIFGCQSMLVEEALQRDLFSWDDIENLYRAFDGNLLSPSICYTCKLAFDSLDSETGQCQECFVENQIPQEIFEWWLVSDWLSERLKIQGEPILNNEYGTWWGRCCTGQAIYLDGVINDIYDEMSNY